MLPGQQQQSFVRSKLSLDYRSIIIKDAKNTVLFIWFASVIRFHNFISKVVIGNFRDIFARICVVTIIENFRMQNVSSWLIKSEIIVLFTLFAHLDWYCNRDILLNKNTINWYYREQHWCAQVCMNSVVSINNFTRSWYKKV